MRHILLLLFVLAACGPRVLPYQTAPRPTDAAFAKSVPVGHTRYLNKSLGKLFTDLTFDTEWGTSVPGLLRVEPPVNVGIVGQGSAPYIEFLDRLLAQIAEQAKVEIARGDAPHDLVVRFVPGSEWGPLADNQCIIIFGQPSWREFLADQERYSDPEGLTADIRDRRTVLIPNTNEPYEIRECLIEEITQALGPTNDIYGLGPSIFNDDDAHVWPTKLDYLMLRVLYDPRMEGGLGRDEATRRAVDILGDINPEGRSAPPLPAHRQKDFLRWREKLHELNQLLMQDKQDARRVSDIVTALIDEAERRAPGTAYHCEALSVAAGVARRRQDASAPELIDRAAEVCATAHGATDIRTADLRLSRAFVALSAERYREALDLTHGLIRIFLDHGQDALVAATEAVRWSALASLGDPRAWEAQRAAIDWSAYAYGNDNAVVERWRRY